MANEKQLDLIDRAKVYQLACAGCTRHGESLGECCHDEPCERLIFAFTVAEPVDAVSVVWCNKCTCWDKAKTDKCGFLICPKTGMKITAKDFCSKGERNDNA